MAGKRSGLVEDEDEDEGEAHPHVSQSLLYQLFATSVFSSTPQLFVHFPMERFFTRRAGPPGTAGAGAQRHAEDEDFLALVRHNAAAQLEMERWPPALKKRRVGKPTMDEQYTQALCNWVATLEAPPEDLPQAKRPGWWRHGMSLFAERSAPTDGAEAVAAAAPVKTKRAYHQPSRDLRLWVVDYALLRHLQGWDNRMIADHLAAWLPDVFRPWLSVRTLRRWLDENKKEGREPRDAVDAIMPILREKCDRVGEAGVPVSASVMQPIFNRVAEQHGMTRRFGIALDPPLPPLRRLQVSRRVRRDQEDDGSQAGGHARGQAPIALDVLRDGVRSAPFLHHEHGRDGREALGPGAPRLGETEAGRTGALHRRH